MMKNRPNASFPNNSVSSDVSGSWTLFCNDGTPFATDGNPSYGNGRVWGDTPMEALASWDTAT
jgi:hypothetical protein